MNNGNSSGIIKLGPLVLLAIGLSVFAMHYGASCMLWPVTWGRNAGTSLWPTFGGFFISGVILPFLAYIAVYKGGGPLFTIAARVGPTFGQIFGAFTVLIMGPFFVIPRMSAAAWDALAQVFGWHAAPWIAIFAFTVAYYSICYWFIYKPGQIIDKLSRILVPLLLILEVAIIIKALFSPIGIPVAKMFTESPFTYGFINGYQTMDLPAALMYAGIIITDVKNRIDPMKPSVELMNRSVGWNLIVGAVVGFIVLFFVFLGEFYLGNSSGSVMADVDYAKLFMSIVVHHWGTVGGAVFNIALVFAAMTTAIGLTAGVGDYFVEASGEKWKYTTICIITLVVSTLISVGGLNAIITWTAPILNMIYPPCIALVLFTIFLPKLRGAMRGACWFSFGWGVVEALNGYLGIIGYENALAGLYSIVPGATLGFGFVVWFILGAVIGHFFLSKADDNLDVAA
jgi:LIVCS family branched-chain amino acid:cation transporter